MPTPEHTQANGLLALFKCDEASGNLVDSSLRGYPATAQGNIAYQQVGKPTLGFGYGVSPTNGNAIAIIQASNDGIWNAAALVVSAQVWFKANSAFNLMPGTKHAFVYKSTVNVDESGWFLGVLPGGGNTLSFRVMDAALSPYTASYVETNFSQFHHYVGTFDGTFVRLYRDGVQVAQTFVSGLLGYDNTKLVTIGEGLDGIIDELAIWNRALTATEIQQLYGQGGYLKFRQSFRVPDFIPFFPNGSNEFPNTALYVTAPVFMIGPFTETVQVRAGDNLGTSDMTAVNDQWVVDGVNWTTPAWVNSSTSHDIAGGTVLGVLTPGQTMTIQIRSRADYGSLQASGMVSVFTSEAVADGLNIRTPIALSTGDAAGPRLESTGLQYQSGIETQLPLPPTAGLFPLLTENAVNFETGGVASIPTANAGGLPAKFDVFENVLVTPNPLVINVSVSNGIITMTGDAGYTNLPYVDLYWQIALSTGYLTIPVSAIWQPFTLTTRQQFITTYALSECQRFNGAAIRFVAEAHGPGSIDQAIRYYSPWVTMVGPGFNSVCSETLPPPPMYPGSVIALADVAPIVGIDLFDVVSADVVQETIYKPTPTASVNGTATPLTFEPQSEMELPAGLYEFEYTGGALFNAGTNRWNYYFGTYFGQHMGGLWLKSGDGEPYYVVAAPCFTATGFVTQAAAQLASIGYKFLFLHTGGKLSVVTDYAPGANSGTVQFTIRNVDSIMFGAGEWTLLDTTMASNPYLDLSTTYAPKLRRLEPGYTRFRYTASVADNKARSQDFVIRVWSKSGGVDASFPYDAPKPPPTNPLGYGGTVRDRRQLFTLPPTSGNRG